MPGLCSTSAATTGFSVSTAAGVCFAATARGLRAVAGFAEGFFAAGFFVIFSAILFNFLIYFKLVLIAFYYFESSQNRFAQAIAVDHIVHGVTDNLLWF